MGGAGRDAPPDSGSRMAPASGIADPHARGRAAGTRIQQRRFPVWEAALLKERSRLELDASLACDRRAHEVAVEFDVAAERRAELARPGLAIEQLDVVDA